ncbi:hypothetical protein B7463_g4856, partial [Scytalidium lignicola]
MKVILTGSTGYIGNQVLLQCLANPSITSIIVLSRRDLKITDPKLKVILHEDFTTYPSELKTQLADADACIYCLGSNIPVKPPELNRRINFDYTITTARENSRIILQLGKENEGTGFEVFVARPGFVQEKGAVLKAWLIGLVGKSIFMPDLAASMVYVALHGYSGAILENEALIELGRKGALGSDSRS